MKDNSKGFTLIEIMLAIAILAVMAAVVAPNLSKRIENTNADTTRARLDIMVSDINYYVIEQGCPQLTDGLTAQELAETFVAKFSADYSSVRLDPSTLSVGANSFTVYTLDSTDAWGNRFALYYTWTNALFAVASAGGDGVMEFNSKKNVAEMDDLIVLFAVK